MKKLSFLLFCCAFFCFSKKAAALITVTAGSGGTNICSSLAVGGSAPAFTTLGNITVSEGTSTDITLGAHTLTLAAPAGWQFNNLAIPTFTFTPGRNITGVTLISITASSLSINVTTSGTSLLDAFTIIGLQVQATSTSAAAGSIRATAATGMTGIFVGFTNFANLSLTAAPAAVSVTGGGVFCDNATITASLVGAGTIFYEDVTAGGTSTATPSTSQSITLQGTHTFYFRARSATGNCWGPSGSATVTINQTPGPITVTPITTSTLCMGDSAKFAAAASTTPVVEILQQDFNSGLGAWTITNNAGIAASFWQIRTSPGYSAIAVGDGSDYMEAAPDATGSGTIPTNTILTSPSFSTVGFTSADLTFNQYYRFYVLDTQASIEYSIDGGANWILISNQGMGSSGLDMGTGTWVSTTPTTTLALPAGALNMPDVMLRWNYNSEWGFYWAIDNIAVNGTPTLSYTWAGLGGATGLSCTTCDTTQITPAAAGLNSYSVTTTEAGCTSGGNVDVTSIALPTVYSVLGGGAYCAGGTGADISLLGSDMGVDYQLYNGATTVGAPVPGTALPIDFGSFTTTGTYTVLATTSVGSCSSPMFDSAVITIIPIPTVDVIVGDPTVCLGATKTLTNTTTGGVWSSADAAIADVDAGGTITGMALGNTTISYTVTGGGCSNSATLDVAVGNTMTPITVSPLVATMCHNSPVTLTATGAGVTYQWELGGVAIPGATDATYTATASGTYTVVADNGTCTANGPAATISPAPTPIIAYNTSGNYLYTGTYATYQWLRNGTSIPGATSSIYPVTMAGDYRVAVTDVNSCADTSAVYTYTTTTSVNTVTAADDIAIYPNPASAVLNISAPYSVSVTIIAPDGRIVVDRVSTTRVDVGGLANGMYLVMVYDEHNTLVKTSKFSKIE